MNIKIAGINGIAIVQNVSPACIIIIDFGTSSPLALYNFLMLTHSRHIINAPIAATPNRSNITTDIKSFHLSQIHGSQQSVESVNCIRRLRFG